MEIRKRENAEAEFGGLKCGQVFYDDGRWHIKTQEIAVNGHVVNAVEVETGLLTRFGETETVHNVDGAFLQER